VDNCDYYVRQFRDMKGAVTIERMDGSALADYGRICGALPAKGHARSIGATMLPGYPGKADVADRACARFRPCLRRPASASAGRQGRQWKQFITATKRTCDRSS
jgi:hypothetical protein